MRQRFCMRCLTFELSGRNRQGAWAASPMISTTGSRPKCLAGGGPLERRVRARLDATVTRMATRPRWRVWRKALGTKS